MLYELIETIKLSLIENTDKEIIRIRKSYEYTYLDKDRDYEIGVICKHREHVESLLKVLSGDFKMSFIYQDQVD